jgi:hypothetical protein
MPDLVLDPLRSRFVFRAALAFAAVAAGCGSPYVARTGPLTPCDTSADSFIPNSPLGVCAWQLNRYQVLLFTMGYVREPDVPGGTRTIQRWSRTWSDTSNVLTVEFAHTNEGGALSNAHYVLRINVSGQTFVKSAGKRGHVRDSASLTRDVDYLAVQLRGLFRQTTRRR